MFEISKVHSSSGEQRSNFPHAFSLRENENRETKMRRTAGNILESWLKLSATANEFHIICHNKLCSMSCTRVHTQIQSQRENMQ
jgi:hypothetical protein